MILYPAIDLKDGKCVRLLRGEMEQCTVFNDDPAAQARTFEKQGFKWLHLVDLNGAFEGKSANGVAVSNILKAINIPDMPAVVLFPINNIGVVLLSTLFSVLLFKEKLSTKKLWGIIFSIISILLLTYQLSQ